MTRLLFYLLIFSISVVNATFANTINQTVLTLTGTNIDTISPPYDLLFPPVYPSNEVVAIKKGKWGMLNEQKQIILPFEYDFLSDFERDSFCIFYKKEKWGRLHRNGTLSEINELQELFKHNQSAFKDGKASICLTFKCGVIDKTGKPIIPLIYSYALQFSNGLAAARLNNKSGIINESNEVVVPFEYESIIDYDKEGKSFVVHKDGISGIMLLDETMIIPLEYESIRPDYRHPNYWFVKKNRKHGIIDKQGKIIVPLIYDELYTGKTIMVEKDGKSAVIDIEGNIKIPFMEGSLQRLNHKEELYLLIKQGKFGLIDRSGKILLDSEYDRISSYTNEILLIKKGNKIGMVRSDGQEFLLPIYDKIGEMPIINHPNNLEGDDYYSVIDGPDKGKKIQFFKALREDFIDVIDYQGKKYFTLSEVEHDYLGAYYLSDSKRFLFNIFKKNGKQNILDDQGKEQLSKSYDRISMMNNEIIQVWEGDKQGIVKTNGEILIPPTYDFMQGLIVGLDGKKGLLKNDYSGLHCDLVFDEIRFEHNGLMTLQKDGLWGLCKVSEMDKVLSAPLLPYEFKAIKKRSDLGRTCYLVQRVKEWKVFDVQKKEILNITFDEIQGNKGRSEFVNLKKGNKWAFYKINSWKNFNEPQFIYDEINGATVRIGNKWGKVGDKYEVSIPIIYEQIRKLDYYTYAVRKDKRWGFIQLKYSKSSPIEYDSIGNVTAQTIEVFKNNKSGIIDFDGNILVPFQNDQLIANRYHQFIFFTKDKKAGVLNRKGKEIIAPIYTNIQTVPSQYYIVTNDLEEVGIVDTTGKIIIPMEEGHFRFTNNSEDIFKENRLIKEKDAKHGAINRNNKIVIPYQYRSIAPFRNGISIASISQKNFLIDTMGTKISDEYDIITPRGNYFKVEKDGKIGVLFRTKQIIPLVYSDLIIDLLYKLDPKVFILKKGEKYGVVDHNNQIVCPFLFDQPVNYLEDGFVILYSPGGVNHVYDGGGYRLLSDSTINFRWLPGSVKRGHLIFEKDKKYGVMDWITQEVIIPPIYTFIQNSVILCDGTTRLTVGDGTAQGVVDTNGNVVIPIKYESIYFNKMSAMFIARKNGKWGWMNKDGNEKSKFIYDNVGIIGNRVIVEKENKVGVLNLQTNKVVFPFEYDLIQCFSLNNSNTTCNSDLEKEEYVFNVKQNGSWFTMTEQGEKLAIFGNQKLEMTNNPSYLKFTKNGKYGLIDKNGKIVIPPNYHYISADPVGFFRVRDAAENNGFYNINEGQFYHLPLYIFSGFGNTPYQRIIKDDKVGLINTDLKWVIEPIYESMSMLSEDLIAVEKNSKTGFINLQNEVIIPFEYGMDLSREKQFKFQNGFAILHKKQKYGIINKANEALIPFEYDAILCLENQKYLGRKNGKWISFDL